MAKKKKVVKGCTCLEQVQKTLAEDGVELVTHMSINFETGKGRVLGPALAVRWKDKPKRGKKLPTVLCSYCPMCGKKQASD